MLARLRHRAFVRRDDQQQDVHSAGPGQHVLDEVLVARHVDDGDLQFFISRREAGEPQIDGDASAPLLLPAICIHSGQRFDQGRLAVVDVTRRPDDDRSHLRRSSRKRKEFSGRWSAKW